MIQPPPSDPAGMEGAGGVVVEKTRQGGCVSECVEQTWHNQSQMKYEF